MAAAIPTTEPECITAGDSTTWTRTFTDYTATDEWALSYSFVQAGKPSLTIATTGSGATFTAALTTANTTLLDSGLWYWQAFLTKTTQRVTAGTGRLTVQVNLATAGPDFDPRSFAKKALDAIESACLAGIREDIEISIDGMVLRFRTFEEMLKARSQYLAIYNAELDAERLANGKGSRKKVLTRFISPS
jgi:hypothetical protein